MRIDLSPPSSQKKWIPIVSIEICPSSRSHWTKRRIVLPTRMVFGQQGESPSERKLINAPHAKRSFFFSFSVQFIYRLAAIPESDGVDFGDPKGVVSLHWKWCFACETIPAVKQKIDGLASTVEGVSPMGISGSTPLFLISSLPSTTLLWLK